MGLEPDEGSLVHLTDLGSALAPENRSERQAPYSSVGQVSVDIVTAMETLDDVNEIYSHFIPILATL